MKGSKPAIRQKPACMSKGKLPSTFSHAEQPLQGNHANLAEIRKLPSAVCDKCQQHHP